MHIDHELLICAGTIMSGSHADSIILGGAYDGILGVLGPIVAIKALHASGFTPRKSIEAVQFTSEEGDRFTEVCFGRCCLLCYRLGCARASCVSGCKITWGTWPLL